MTDTDHVRAVVEALEADGWDVSHSRVREDAVVVAGDRNVDAAVSTVLGLVVDADSEVTPKYVKYLVKTAGERDADTAFVSTLGTLTPDARALAEEYGVTVVDPDAVGTSGATESAASTAESTVTDSTSVSMAQDSASEAKSLPADESAEPAPADPEHSGSDDGARDEAVSDGDEPGAEAAWESWAIDDGSAADAVSDAAAGSSATVTSSDERPATSEPRDGGQLDEADGGHEPRATAEQWEATPERDGDTAPLGRLTSGPAMIVVVALLAVGLLMAGGIDTGPLGGGTDNGPVDGGPTTDATPGQSRSADTEQESTQQVGSTVDVVSAVGSVSDGAVGTVNLTVRLAPGSESLDLSNATVGWSGPSESRKLVWGESATEATFATREVKGESATVLDEQDDRIQLSVDADAIAGGLEPGSTLELTITTDSGHTTVFTATVPDSVDGRDVVML